MRMLLGTLPKYSHFPAKNEKKTRFSCDYEMINRGLLSRAAQIFGLYYYRLLLIHFLLRARHVRAPAHIIYTCVNNAYDMGY